MLSMCLVLASAAAATGDVVGWRGDGSGVYPKADPPIEWQRVSKAVAALRVQAEPPKGDGPSGQPMPDGVIREWLVLGPVATRKGAKKTTTDALLAEDQSKFSPAAGQRSAGAEWKVVKTDTAYIDFAREFDTYDKNVEKSAYATVWVWSPADGGFILRVMHTGTLNLWLNGKPTHKFSNTQLNYTPQMVRLARGWNRLLLRSTPQRGPARSRPIVGTWYVNLAIEANPAGAEYDRKNIAWTTALPAPNGFGGPIVVGGKILLQSEPADLVCLDKRTGKILWVRANNYNELATDDEKKTHADVFKEIAPLAARLKEVNDSFASDAPPKLERADGREEFKEKTDLQKKLYDLMKKVDRRKYSLPRGQDVGYSGLTPVSDGRHVWAWFATGGTCCYDLDGKLVWRRLDNEGSFFEHGYSTSPILADGKIIVFMNKMIAFDAAKGDRVWTTEFNRREYWANRFHGTPAAATVGRTPVCILPTGYILRLSDGRIIYGKGPGVSHHQQEIPSPVVVGNTVYRLSTWNEFSKTTLPAVATDPLKMDAVRQLKMDLEHYPTNYLAWHMCSPLIHDGLAYLVNNTGVLTVVDVETMEVVYEKLLDLDHFQTAHEGAGRGISVSPALAASRPDGTRGPEGSGRIYLLGNTGATLVIKPGREYEQLAKNRIERVFWRYWGMRHERFVAPPAFDGKTLFIRGDRFLYRIGK